MLLILGHRWDDETLGVPLVVWTTGAAESRTISDDRLPVTINSEWGKARNISSITRLLESASALLETLSDQRIVWVEGDHLPSSIHLAQGTKGIELNR